VAGPELLYLDHMTWRAINNALAGLLAGVAGGVLLGALIVIWGVTLFTLATSVDNWEHVAVYVGIVVLITALTPWLVHGLSAMQRSRLRATLGAEIPAPVRPLGRTGHQLAYHLLAVPVGLAGGLLAVLFPVAPWLASQFTRADEGLARALLGPGRRESLAQRVESLARSRADLVAAADAERRRIERDLHDGAQQRLVSLAMNLGMARERFESEAEPVRQAIAAAHDEAVLALTELREFIRGLHPAVLSDRGLDAALSGLAGRAPLPVRLRVDVPKPASPGVEAVAYFIVSEALTNVVKHAQATRAEVTVTRAGDVLRIAVTDDGRGGASPGAGDGTGLRGLEQRAAAVDGTLSIDSPPGGPTTIIAELPCES
jgi:signal transduction histidine kinase